MPKIIADLTKQITDLGKTVTELTFRLNTHKHTGVDLTAPLAFFNASAFYAGYATAAGGNTPPFPKGWSVTKNGTGDYTVTHNLGTTAYAVVGTAHGSDLLLFEYQHNANDFRVGTESSGGAPTNADFYFIMIVA